MLITLADYILVKQQMSTFIAKVKSLLLSLLLLLLLLLLLPDRVQFNFSMLTQLNRPACLLGAYYLRLTW